MELARGIEPPTCGLQIAKNPAPLQQIKDLAMQIAANSSKRYASPQLAATRNLMKGRRHDHMTHRVNIAGQRTSVHDDQYPAEIFVGLKEMDCSSETHRPLRCGRPPDEPRAAVRRALLEKVGDLLLRAKFARCCHFFDHDHLQQLSSLPRSIGHTAVDL